MRKRILQSLREALELKRILLGSCTEEVEQAAAAIAGCLQSGGKVLLFGNGGSAADAQHVAAEFVGRFARERGPLPAIALTTDSSVLTAIGNDYGFEHVFARQIQALGRPGDVAVAISTSGRSPNVLAAVQAGREAGLMIIGLTGMDGGSLARQADIAITVPSMNTARIQEAHITIAHILCEAAEAVLFNPPDSQVAEPAAVSRGKVVDWDTLLKLRELWRAGGKVVIWTNGCFDLLHAGHVRSLRAARALGDVLVVGLNSDKSVRLLKGPGRPITPAPERREILAALDCVDYVITFDETTPESALARLQPDVHCKGEEYAPPSGKPVPELEVIKRYGGQIKFLPFFPQRSTSELIRQIRNLPGGEKL